LSQDPIRKPILVTGIHRSGTTWAGKMLSVGGGVVYISEPLNVWHRPGVFAAPVDCWYTYICDDNQDEYLTSFKQLLRLEYHTSNEIRSLRSLKDTGRFLRDWSAFSSGRRHRDRILIKDPFAVFSVPWFKDRLDFQVVITVRHPAAVISSLKRLNWAFDFNHLLSQSLLMRDHLGPFQEDMLAIIDDQADIIDQASLLWRMIYFVVSQYQSQFKSLQVVRHEDLSLDPLQAYGMLYDQLGLVFTPRATKAITNSSKTGNPQERRKSAVHATQLDSRANLNNWKARLSPQEIERIHHLTGDIASNYYSNATWD
jgi:hypothetical protein